MNLPSKLSAPAERTLRKCVWLLTAIVLVVVGMMRNPKFHIILPGGISLDFLPAVYSALNCLVALSLILAVLAVKKGNLHAHRRFINAALILSGLFLLGYIAYHFTSTETKFTGTGWVRPVYFFLLITHIVFAALSLPFILLAYLAGWADRREAHRRLVKFVFPVWFYVAVSGPIVYLMLHILKW
jgi:putative membrane protein